MAEEVTAVARIVFGFILVVGELNFVEEGIVIICLSSGCYLLDIDPPLALLV